MTAVEEPDEWVVPFTATADEYLERGWWPLPLPVMDKWPPPTGFTGSRSAKAPTADDLRRWNNVGRFGSKPSHVIGNICLRMPPDIIGIDVDAYTKGEEIKRGDVSLAAFVEQWGELPDTYSSTARGWGESRIRFYRVPYGTRLRGAPADGIEIIQHTHRYAVVWPSVNPLTNTMYEWFDAEGDECGIPDPAELPDLPWSWIEGLRAIRGEGSSSVPATPAELEEFYADACGAAMPHALKGVRKVLDAEGARHDRLVKAACWIAREAAAGWYPMAQAEQYLRAWWSDVMDDRERLDGTEFDDAIAWGVAQVDRASEQFADKARQANEARSISSQRRSPSYEALLTSAPHVIGEAGEVSVGSEEGSVDRTSFSASAPILGANLPETFWQSRPVLDHIRQAAHSRSRSADAVLGAVLTYVSVLVPPTLRLPAIVSTQATVDLLVALVAGSGEGKSSAAGIAGELVPIDDEEIVVGLVLGSGEGLVDAYVDSVEVEVNGKKVTERRQTKRAVLAYVDEGQMLTEVGSRRGSTLMPTLRSAWSGQTLGQANASTERKRRIEAGRYRFAGLIAVQVEHAVALIDDAAGGTPQRILWLSATDPSIPDDDPPWPGRLELDLPDVHHFTMISEFAVADEVRQEIKVRGKARSRGQASGHDPLDAHADLVRLKVAALLGVMDGRRSVTVDDWDLAGQITRTSRLVRTIIVESARIADRHREEATIARAIRKEVAIAGTTESRALDRAAKAVARKVHRTPGEPLPKRLLTQAITGKDRDAVTVDDAIAEAERLGWITAIDGGWTAGKARPT